MSGRYNLRNRAKAKPVPEETQTQMKRKANKPRNPVVVEKKKHKSEFVDLTREEEQQHCQEEPQSASEIIQQQNQEYAAVLHKELERQWGEARLKLEQEQNVQQQKQSFDEALAELKRYTSTCDDPWQTSIIAPNGFRENFTFQRDMPLRVLLNYCCVAYHLQPAKFHFTLAFPRQIFKFNYLSFMGHCITSLPDKSLLRIVEE